MKILLTANKTYRGIIDTTWWYFYQPLLSLGHEVLFYDTVKGSDVEYEDLIQKFKPDLIFCIMTGDKSIAPHEPWEAISKETEKGLVKTFNWFCDDTWRFDTFSSKVSHLFHVCSTPEPTYLPKFKSIGYENIINANWHANSSFFKPKAFDTKNSIVSFIGSPNHQRDVFIKSSEIEIEYFNNLSQEDLFNKFCDTKIGLNLSFNSNDVNLKTQMKQRLFEITAGGGLLMTQNHNGIEEYYQVDKEIVTFESKIEFIEKTKFLLKNMKLTEKIASNGYQRFLKEHDSTVRLSRVLKEIQDK